MSTGGSAGEELLRTESVGMRFRGVTALEEVSLSITRHEAVGIIGPNGAGKTTLFNIIAGVHRPTSGRVFFEGQDITGLPPHRRLRLGIARTFQLIKPFASLTVAENILVGATGAGLPRSRAGTVVDEMVERFALGRLAQKSAGSVNAAEGKRMEVARALATGPKLVLLDEVFSGLNAEEVEELAGTVAGLHATGLTVLLIEHNLDAIRQVAQTVVAITAGRVVSSGDADHVFSDPRVVESYLGHRARA